MYICGLGGRSGTSNSGMIQGAKMALRQRPSSDRAPPSEHIGLMPPNGPLLISPARVYLDMRAAGALPSPAEARLRLPETPGSSTFRPATAAGADDAAAVPGRGRKDCHEEGLGALRAVLRKVRRFASLTRSQAAPGQAHDVDGSGVMT